MEKVFFKECFLTDIIKYDALTVWDKLKNGISLELEYRPVPFDEDKKRVFAWFKDNKQKYYIGSLSKEDSNMIEQLIYMEWSNVFICKISHVDKDAANDQRIKVAIYINKNSHQSDKNDRTLKR